jgi:predicted lysophospholipase L1 biosynthesis ABC-type transport system permease subunit
LQRISYLLVSVDSSSDLDAVEHLIAQSFPSLRITDQRHVAETVSGSLVAAATVVSQARLWLVLLAVVGGALNLAAFAYVSNRRRYRDFAILRAIGWGRPRLVWQAVLETCLLGVVGTSIGALLAWPLAPLVRSGIPALSAADTQGNLITVRVPLSPDPVHALLAAILLLAVGALVGLAAGLSAASIDPGRGLRDVE